ncbi:hypothetical protein C2E20_7094 [Micractinium conductrix]|uniref:Apple domain-containing protein n=1 Tax=Micractinium conductrix TaxID=554055 RepID=A0A2P6V5G5_9CHLO|nr:hypothetical protein C2E20_7094 [Micractinium conductrix]|eukprot:PSC69307.1 hypothetical protein C2E20_7094 [Micractinium conductrix]
MHAWVLRPTSVAAGAFKEPLAVAALHEPEYNGLPLDWCRSYPGNGCGEPAASARCQQDGFPHAVEVGPYAASNSTGYPGQTNICKGGCTAFSSIACGTRGSPGLVKFVSPRDGPTPLDTCQAWNCVGCGAPAATAWCKQQGMKSAVVIGSYTRSPAAGGATSFPGKAYTCVGSCTTFSEITCSTQGNVATAWFKLQGMTSAAVVGRYVPSPRDDRTTSFPGRTDVCTGGCTIFSEITCSTQVGASQPINFTEPHYDGLPIDWCFPSVGSSSCGGPAADAYCVEQGAGVAAAWGPRVPSPTGETSFLDNKTCGATNCSTFAWVSCSPAPPYGTGYEACSATRRLYSFELVGGVVLVGGLTSATYADCCATCNAQIGCTGWTWKRGTCKLLVAGWSEEPRALSPAVYSGTWASPAGTPSVVAAEGASVYASCAVGQAISNILSPQFGAGAANATSSYQEVAARCLGYNSCEVAATIEVFGEDPAPGGGLKFLSFSYSCAFAPPN